MAKLLLDVVKRLADKALQSDADRPGIMTVRWDVSGNCEQPVYREVFARPGPPKPEYDPVKQRMVGQRDIIVGPGKPTPVRVQLVLRCRTCRKCLLLRSYQWTDRALIETARSCRTWFGTITLRPEFQDRALNLARLAASKKGGDLDTYSEKDQFVLRCRAISPWLTKYLKRVRKESGASFKYLLVAEAHKSGLPHYHILIHEQDRDISVKYDTLKNQWPFGFTQFKLVTDKKQATYLCKYLSKSNAARVRASIGYGKTTESHSEYTSVQPRPPTQARQQADRMETVLCNRTDTPGPGVGLR